MELIFLYLAVLLLIFLALAYVKCASLKKSKAALSDAKNLKFQMICLC